MSFSAGKRQGNRRTFLRRSRLALDRRGISGPFEDLPVFMVVTVTLIIFFVTLNNTMVLYENQRRSVELERFCDSFSTSILTYTPMMHEEGARGLYDGEKVRTATVFQVSRDLEVNVGLYGFNVTMYDVSGYPETKPYNISLATGNPNPRAAISRAYAVSIWVGPDEIHAARMIVRVWYNGGGV